MKLPLLLIIALFCFNDITCAQNSNAINRDTCIAKNQGELEDCWAVKVFKNEYQKSEFYKYGGLVLEINNNVLKYDKQYFVMIDSKESSKMIFERGIIYPALVSETNSSPKMPDSVINRRGKFFNLFKGDSLYIAHVEEMIFLSISPQIKRFRFWLYREGLINPTVYLFELENKKATKNTDLLGFIEGAKLTFINKGWLVM